MPTKKSNPGKRAGNKHKTSARQNATKRVAERDRTSATPKTPTTQEASHGRFPGETPLTGEDRPADRPGAKRGRGSSRKSS
jgi:hypothetical protein